MTGVDGLFLPISADTSRQMNVTFTTHKHASHYHYQAGYLATDVCVCSLMCEEKGTAGGTKLELRCRENPNKTAVPIFRKSPLFPSQQFRISLHISFFSSTHEGTHRHTAVC